MNPAVTALICSHNPRADYLALTLQSLRRQEGVVDRDWELILVDNASDQPIESHVDLSWHPRARIVREERLGLAHARFSGFRLAAGDIIVCIDDDNVLDCDFLRLAIGSMVADPTLGAAGGKSVPRYETPPPDWFDRLGLDLACRDLGDAPLYASWDGAEQGLRDYPECAPVGAGLVIRREAIAKYVEAAERDPKRASLGRKGADLAGGEDNDMILTLLGSGWKVAYLPTLRLEHLIPSRRLTRSYLAQYAYSTNRTWVQVLSSHGIRPWRPLNIRTLPLRKARLYLALGAWRTDAAFVRWRGACGVLDGQAQQPVG
jgi:glycosyltransferase involved in cell wall biosynthesis